MDTNDIKQLADIMRKNQITRLEWEDGKSRLHLERLPGQAVPAVCLPEDVLAGEETDSAGAPQENASLQEITAPMVGVFYAAKAPGEKPFVSVGDLIKPGDTLCIIEAMKLMNEITAEKGGRVAEVCVADGAIVEYGQPLFRLA